MSFSFPTSHLKAAPPIGVATARAPSGSISATTTLAAPARWNASNIAFPMPLPPPVTTTTLPVTCMAALPLIFLCQHDQVEYSRIMAGRAEQDEAMPDRVLEAQALPGVEHHAQTIEYASRHHEPQRQRRHRLHHGIAEHHAAPAQRQIKAHGQAIVSPRQRQLQHDTRDRDAPHPDQQRNREIALPQRHDE